MVKYLPNAPVSALPKEAILREKRGNTVKRTDATRGKRISRREVFPDGGREKEFYIYGKNR